MHTDNFPQWDKSTNPFYEVWYFKLNLPSGEGLWARLTTLSSWSTEGVNRQVAEVWAIFFGEQKLAVKNTYPGSELQFSTDAEKIQIKDSFWGNGKTAGIVRSNDTAIAWDLNFEGQGATFFHVPTLIKKFKLAKSTVCKPNLDLIFTGTISVQGKVFQVNQAHGCQGHIWGKGYPLQWAWAHCNLFDQKLCVEMLSARVKLGGLVTSPFMSALSIKTPTQHFEFNELKDSLSIQTKYSQNGWSMLAERQGTQIAIEVEAQDNDFIGVTYTTPQEKKYFCYNTPHANMVVTITNEQGKVQRFVAQRTASFETVSEQQVDSMSLLI